VRVATFNLLHGRRLSDGATRAEDLLAVGRALDADLVALQEVDRGQDRSGCVDQAAVVADALGAGWWRFVPALEGTPGGAWSPSYVDDGTTLTGPAYGIALLSRYPVSSWQVRRFGPAPVGMPLHVAGRRGLVAVADEPRVAVAAQVDTPAGTVTVIATHLSFVPGWNVGQLRALRRWTRSMPGPRLLLGDVNLPGPVVRATTGWTQLARALPTYPSWRPRVQFDHVLADRAMPVVAAFAPALPVSDHRAAVVDLADPPRG
jgi:endonuclease/exonuclease/phosphatase family metal-dependent hydrolase